ncbi:MAG TPA: pyridoxine 5'-phosphate synthase [Planctomycetota bacterium]|nr:pyridoxine 5'-phosphate synthase [Planctomycetota bacterium]
MIRLGVNIDHVATVRQARRTTEPDPVRAAVLAELGGADQITLHLREDRRHIQDRDLELLRATVTTKLNLEMGMNEEIIDIALTVKPDQVTLVPERREEITTEGGLDASGEVERLTGVIGRFHDAGIEVSLFIDPEREQIDTARSVEADAVELHTGAYAEATGLESVRKEVYRLHLAAILARNAHLHVAAGHGLTYTNVDRVVNLLEIQELNIGHSIISRAVFVGLERAVREMKELLRR